MIHQLAHALLPIPRSTLGFNLKRELLSFQLCTAVESLLEISPKSKIALFTDILQIALTANISQEV